MKILKKNFFEKLKLGNTDQGTTYNFLKNNVLT